MTDERDSTDEKVGRVREGSRATSFLLFLAVGLFLLVTIFGADSWAFYLGSWGVVAAAWYRSGLT